MKTKLIQTKNYLLLIDEEAEININDYWIYLNSNEEFDGIIIKSNLTEKEWFSKLHDRFAYKKVIAYYPLTKEAKELDLPLLPNPFEEVDVNVQTRNFNKQVKNPFLVEEKEYQVWEEAYIKGFDDGIAQSKQFSLEDMKKVIEMAREGKTCIGGGSDYVEDGEADDCVDWYHTEKQIIESLSTQQLPKEFIPETYCNYGNDCPSKGAYDKQHLCDIRIKTITNSEGKQELVGKYTY